jgi:hypothetical protein
MRGIPTSASPGCTYCSAWRRVSGNAPALSGVTCPSGTGSGAQSPAVAAAYSSPAAGEYARACHTTPAMPNCRTAAETRAARRRKLLPGAVARLLCALHANQHAGLLILPRVNANSGQLAHLRVGAIRADNQPGRALAAVAQTQCRAGLLPLHLL